MNVKGFLSCIWYQQICHLFRCVNVSSASGGTETSHSLCSVSKIIYSVKAATYCDGGSFLSPDLLLTNDISPPKSKAGQCCCSVNPLHCLLSQMDYIIQLWSEKMLLLEMENCSPRTKGFLLPSVYCYHNLGLFRAPV